jgi:flagellar biosynthesis/type III secretory pathway protein FliH
VERSAQAKWIFTRRLYDLGYSREAIIDLFRFIDWLLQLPDALEDRFWAAVQQYEEQQRMSYITSVERIGMRKGLEQGLEQGRQEGRRESLLDGIALALELKFGAESQPIMAEIREIADLTVIQAV